MTPSSLQSESDFIHDLSNPLSAALFWTELMQDPKAPIPTDEVARKIHRLMLDMRSILEARRTELKQRAQSAA